MQTTPAFSYGFPVVLYQGIGRDMANYRSALNKENGNNFSEERTTAFRDTVNTAIRAALISGELPVYRSPDLEIIKDYDFFEPSTDAVIMWHDIKKVIEKKLPYQRMPEKPVFSSEFEGMEKQRLAIESFNAEQQAKRKALNQAETNSVGGVQPNNNDCKFSGLLNIPKKADDWFQVIDDMVKIFHTQYEKLPNETQAWGQLWETPPASYSITTGKESANGEDCLNMPSVRLLSRSAFKKRWKKYTDKPQ